MVPERFRAFSITRAVLRFLSFWFEVITSLILWALSMVVSDQLYSLPDIRRHAAGLKLRRQNLHVEMRNAVRPFPAAQALRPISLCPTSAGMRLPGADLDKRDGINSFLIAGRQRNTSQKSCSGLTGELHSASWTLRDALLPRQNILKNTRPGILPLSSAPILERAGLPLRHAGSFRV